MSRKTFGSLLVIIFFSNPTFSQALGPLPMAWHSMGLNADGTVYTWGNNDTGQLGDGTTTTSSPYGKLTPVRVLKGEYSGTTYLGDNPSNRIIAVAGGRQFSLALAEDGTVFAWGLNNRGQLGNNSTTDSSTPLKVLKGAYNGTSTLGDDAGNKIIAIAADRFSSRALAADGTVFSWGYNYYGELGDGSTTQRLTPIQVVKGAYTGTSYLGDDSGNKITTIAAGSQQSLAVAADGTVYAWGYGSNGNIGDGFTSHRYSPTKVKMGEYSGTTYLGDNSGNKMIAVTAGSGHAAALATDGTAYCWGANTNGQLGDNSNSQRTTPVHVLMGAYPGTSYLGDDANKKITTLELGFYSSAALTSDGQVYTWGYNGWYNLGDGSNSNRWTPVKVLKGAYDGTSYLGDNSGNPITDIAFGTDFGLALGTNNKLYAWGTNSYGQLGDNSTTIRSTPIIVHGVDDESDLSLPVELTAFSAKVENGSITLDWTTASETENLGFILERRATHAEWLEIASYLTHNSLVGQGSVTRQNKYSFIDDDVLIGEIYDYRLADISYSGEKEYYPLMVVGILVEDNLPSTYFIMQNYPNPFNPSTSISYGLPQQSSVGLSIYDVQGQLVKTLQQGVKAPGNYEVQWLGMDQQGNPVSTGVYFCRLTAGSYSKTIKMVYLR